NPRLEGARDRYRCHDHALVRQRQGVRPARCVVRRRRDARHRRGRDRRPLGRHRRGGNRAVSEETAEKAEAPPEVTWPIVVKLAYPVEWGKGTVEQLEFRRGTMGDLGNNTTPGEMPTFDTLLLIASRLCGQPVAMLKKLDAEDGAEVQAIALHFF